MVDQPADNENNVVLSVRFKPSDSNETIRLGRITISDNRTISLVGVSGMPAERLRKVIKEMEDEVRLELDIEEVAIDEDGSEVYLHKTKFVDKGDSLYVPALRQYLRTKQFLTKHVHAR